MRSQFRSAVATVVLASTMTFAQKSEQPTDPGFESESQTEAPAHRVDRRPSFIFNMQNGPEWSRRNREYLNLADDRDGNGIRDGFDQLIAHRLDRHYDAGWRRFLFNRVTGDLRYSFEEMTPGQQDGYLVAIRNWALEHPDASLEAYIRLDDLREASIFRISDAPDKAELLAAIEPWVHAGFSAVWIDSGQFYSEELAKLNGDPRLVNPITGRPTYIGSEAGGWLVDRRDRSWPVDRLPWLARTINPLWRKTIDGVFTDVPESANVGVWIADGFTLTAENFQAILDSGKWIVSHEGSNDGVPGIYRRVFDFGVIENPADFNGDGRIDRRDIDTFMAHADAGVAHDREPSFYEGDVNNDGKINAEDIAVFTRAYAQRGGDPIDLGPCRQPGEWPMNEEDDAETDDVGFSFAAVAPEDMPEGPTYDVERRQPLRQWSTEGENTRSDDTPRSSQGGGSGFSRPDPTPPAPGVKAKPPPTPPPPPAPVKVAPPPPPPPAPVVYAPPQPTLAQLVIARLRALFGG